jgi:hypothetical protein
MHYPHQQPLMVIYSWTIDTLDILEDTSIIINFIAKTTSATSTPVLITAKVLAPILDIDTTNNISVINSMVVGANDPNDKTCLQGSLYTTTQLANRDYLEYIIRFQNDGNFQTSFINIKDTIAYLLDLSSFEVVSSSHPVIASAYGNALNFQFDPCFLLPHAQDTLASQGFVKYKIRPLSGIKIGDEIKNTAHIYFDYNGAIVTNTTTTAIVYPTAINTSIKSNNNTILIYPNPASTSFIIDRSLINSYNNLTAQMYNMTGQLVKTILLSHIKTESNINELPASNYIIVVRNDANKVIINNKLLLDKYTLFLIYCFTNLVIVF